MSGITERIPMEMPHLSSAAAVLELLPDICLMLDADRRVVFANRAALSHFGKSRLSEVAGQRPGDLMGCTHALSSEGGCGTTEYCTVCGALHAIRAAQALRHEMHECRIRSRNSSAIDIEVWGRPLRIGGSDMVFLTIRDISNAKRREVLERTFYHDVLNTASGIAGLSDMLRSVDGDENERREINRMLWHLSEELLEEIQQHRDLASAERRELKTNLAEVDLEEIFQRLRNRFHNHPAKVGREIVWRPHDPGFRFRTDPGLLSRVMVNMVKNALEAVEAGAEVAVFTRLEEGGELRFCVENPGEIPRGTALQIFQHSFSTKGNGRGIGTYSMKLLGEEYLGGRVGFVTSDGRTVFHIVLPIE